MAKEVRTVTTIPHPQRPHRLQRMSFRMMSFVHETLYGLLRDPFKLLDAAGVSLGQNVLEIGCGPGFYTVPAARAVGSKGSILAIDVNPLAVQHVRNKIKEAGATNAKTILADAVQTGLPDQSLDLIFLFGFAHPIGNVRKVWTELDRILKPDGTLSVEGRLWPPHGLFRRVKRQGRITQYRKAQQELTRERD
jgi:ubiquinone/menaquinone biosynthesis C-methylase UbiE